MRVRRLFSYPLSLAVVVALLIALTGGWIAWWNYRSGVANVRSLASRLFDQVAGQTADATQQFLATAQPPAEALRGMAADDDADVDRDVLARRFVAVLRANPNFAWVSYSRADGSFIGVTPVGDHLEVNESQIVDGVTSREEHVVAADGTWGATTHSADTHYDPRTRPYYQLAERAPNGRAWTAPYVFAGQHVPGITYALANGQRGVFTIDFGLARLSELAAELQFSPHGRLVITTADGTVIAHPTAPVVKPATTTDGEPTLITASELADPAVRQILAATEVGEHGELDLDGEAYLVRRVAVHVPDGPEWQVLAFAPERDFTAGLRDRVISSLLISLAAVLIAVGIAWALARRVSTPLVALADEMVRVGDFRIEDGSARRRSMFREIEGMNHALAKMKGGLRSFAKYVPRDLVRDVIASGQDAELAGELRVMTVYFSDLAGFTSLAESRTPHELVMLLGGYFHDMSQIIAAEHGTVDKYLGDGIMAFWGAPGRLADHAVRACAAALQSDVRVQEMAAAGTPFAARIGIATGEVLVGNIGSPERMNYTVMGDTANLAARLESLNKQYGTSLMIGESTYEAAGSQIVARAIDVVAVKGKQQGVRVYELLAMAATATPDQLELAAQSAAALTAYLARDFTAAASAWSRVLALRPGDPAATLLRSRAIAFADAPPPVEWTGVTTATEK